METEDFSTRLLQKTLSGLPFIKSDEPGVPERVLISLCSQISQQIGKRTNGTLMSDHRECRRRKRGSIETMLYRPKIIIKVKQIHITETFVFCIKISIVR